MNLANKRNHVEGKIAQKILTVWPQISFSSYFSRMPYQIDSKCKERVVRPDVFLAACSGSSKQNAVCTPSRGLLVSQNAWFRFNAIALEASELLPWKGRPKIDNLNPKNDQFLFWGNHWREWQQGKDCLSGVRWDCLSYKAAWKQSSHPRSGVPFSHQSSIFSLKLYPKICWDPGSSVVIMDTPKQGALGWLISNLIFWAYFVCCFPRNQLGQIKMPPSTFLSVFYSSQANKPW